MSMLLKEYRICMPFSVEEVIFLNFSVAAQNLGVAFLLCVVCLYCLASVVEHPF